MPFLLVLTTAPTKKEALKLTHLILDKRLAACVNIAGRAESHYWWKGKKEKGREIMMFIKTRAAAFRKLAKLIQNNHSYSNPEVIGIPFKKGSPAYLSWLSGEVRS